MLIARHANWKVHEHGIEILKSRVGPGNGPVHNESMIGVLPLNLACLEKICALYVDRIAFGDDTLRRLRKIVRLKRDERAVDLRDEKPTAKVIAQPLE